MYIIENKEAYLALKASWKNFIKEGKHKKQKKFHTDYRGQPTDYYYWYSDLHDQHHLLYALIRNAKLSKTFSKTKDGKWPKHVFDGLGHTLRWAAIEGANQTEYIEQMNRIFGGGISKEVLNEVRNRLAAISKVTDNFNNIDGV